MSRYTYNKKKRAKNIDQVDPRFNKLVKTTTIIPKVTTKTTDNIIIASSTDRLDNLANRFYKDRTLWWIIAAANDLPGDSLFVEPGTQLVIPKDVAAIRGNLDTLNNIQPE
tara:strand:+ start:516 stop:848 length:333 start_codon:yes stop_codon:yes gene_type:complete